MKLSRPTTMAAALLWLAGCAPQSGAPVAADWQGRWNGPEGTWLEISPAGTDYLVTIRNLDGARSFPASAVATGLQFERDGTRETLRATDGAATGMKWLLEKSQCLTVRTGEGYCRD